MSTPEEVWINSKDGGGFVEVFIGKRASADLFAYMVPRMYEVAPDYAEEFEYGNWEIFSVRSAPAKDYPAVVALFMEACDALETVKPYKQELKAALEADPRFKN